MRHRHGIRTINTAFVAVLGFGFVSFVLAENATPPIPENSRVTQAGHGTRLVMLVRPMEIEKNTMMSQYANGRTTGFAWARDGIGYSLVGAAAPEVLHPLADEIRRQTAKDV